MTSSGLTTSNQPFTMGSMVTVIATEVNICGKCGDLYFPGDQILILPDDDPLCSQCLDMSTP
jgi:hypothetical protein